MKVSMFLRTGIFIYIILLLSGCELYTAIPPTVTPRPAPTIQSFAPLGKGSIRMFAWSPNGHELAMATSLGIRLLNAQSLEEIGFINTKASIQSISYSPNGEFIASIDRHSGIFFWNARTKQLAKEVTGIPVLDGGSSIAFSPDGDWLVVSTYRKLYVLNVETEEVVYVWDFSPNSVAFSPDGQLIAAAGSNSGGQVIRVWEIESGRAIHTFDNGVMDTVWSLTFTPDSKIVIGGSNSYTRYWDIKRGKELETRVVSPLRLVTAMSVDPRGNKLALSDDCGRVRLVNLPYGPESILQEECSNERGALAFSPDGKTLALGPDDNTIKFWGVESGQQLEVLNGNQEVYPKSWTGKSGIKCGEQEQEKQH